VRLNHEWTRSGKEREIYRGDAEAQSEENIQVPTSNIRRNSKHQTPKTDLTTNGREVHFCHRERREHRDGGQAQVVGFPAFLELFGSRKKGRGSGRGRTTKGAKTR